MSLKKKKIVVGITGGIAIYKVCSLVRLFIREGAEVRVIMTKAATEMISPLTFQALSGFEVFTDNSSQSILPNAISHIYLAEWGDAFVLAPATANTIGKIVNGLADNLLTSTIIAWPSEKPLIIAPSMNKHMWNNIFFQDNLQELKKAKNYYLVQ